MTEKLRFETAGREAELLLARLGIETLPVDPFAIARQHNIEVAPKDSNEPGVSGFLVKTGDTFGIMHATHIRNEGFIRFCVAHELGHYFLPGHPALLFPDGNGLHKSTSGFISRDSHEVEADHFAAGLLMPEKLFRKALRKAGQGFSAIESLAGICKTSITSAAIRYAKFTEAPVAVIVSTAGTVDFCFVSDALGQIRGVYPIRRGAIIPAGTETYRFSQDNNNVRRALRTEGTSGLDLWFDGALELEVQEDVVGLGSYGKMLTVLFVDELPDEEDEEESEE